MWVCVSFEFPNSRMIDSVVLPGSVCNRGQAIATAKERLDFPVTAARQSAYQCVKPSGFVPEKIENFCSNEPERGEREISTRNAFRSVAWQRNNPANFRHGLAGGAATLPAPSSGAVPATRRHGSRTRRGCSPSCGRRPSDSCRAFRPLH